MRFMWLVCTFDVANTTPTPRKNQGGFTAEDRLSVAYKLQSNIESLVLGKGYRWVLSATPYFLSLSGFFYSERNGNFHPKLSSILILVPPAELIYLSVGGVGRDLLRACAAPKLVSTNGSIKTTRNNSVQLHK